MTLRAGVDVQLGVWDIGGQNAGSRMLDKYIYGSQVVFLIYDVTDPKSFTDLEDWLRAVRAPFAAGPAAAGGGPTAKPPLVFLAGNKMDLEHLRRVTSLMHDRFLEEHRLAGGFYISAQSGENVLTVFCKAAAAVAGITLTAGELSMTRKVLSVSVAAGAEDKGRTKIADDIEAEDAEAEKRMRAAIRAGDGGCRCLLQ